MKKIVYLVGFVAVISSFAWASQEGALALSTFSLESNGIGESGAVEVKGTISENKEVTALSVNAFGKTYIVPAEKLSKIQNGFYNGIQLSYEAGYKELGGKTIYIVLQSGFTSGVTQRIMISLTESGTIEIESLTPLDRKSEHL